MTAMPGLPFTLPVRWMRIAIVAGLCVLGLIGLVVREGMAREAGAEVLLPMAGVDPREILGGHYVIVSLQEPLAADQTCPENPAPRGWIALKAQGGVHHYAGFAASRADALRIAPLVVEGGLTCVAASGDALWGSSTGRVLLYLGVERFYVGQSQAQRIDTLLRHANRDAPSPVNAIVSIGQDGRARLKGLSVNGERLELSWL